MRLFGMDCETDDPFLTDKGPSWVFSEGKIIVTGTYDAAKQEKKSYDGCGGKAFRNMLSSSAYTFVGANIGYDVGWLCYEHKMKTHEVKAELIDVSIAESLIDEYQLYSLDALAWKYLRERKKAHALVAICDSLGYKGDFRKHLLKLWDWAEKLTREKYRELIRDYVQDDADQPVRIWEKQRVILEEQGLMPAFWINMKMMRGTQGMKRRGVPIDYARWQHNSVIAGKVHDQLKLDFTTKYGEINIRSGKQLAVLFDKYKVPYKYKVVFKGWAPEGRKFDKAKDGFSGDIVWDQRKRLKEFFPNVRVSKGKIILMVPSQYADRTATQAINMGYEVTCNPSINKFTFVATKETYPVVADVVELKQVSNIVDKFLGPNLERFLVKYPDGTVRLHGDLNPVGARQTGRMGASHPNLQNIPSKTMLFSTLFELPESLRELCKDICIPARMEDGKLVPGGINLAHMCREVFIPEQGHIMCKLDFNGQENRLQAHFAVNNPLTGNNGDRIRAMYTANPRLDEHQFVADASGLQEKHGKKNGRKYAKNVRFGLGYGMMIATMCEQFGWSKEFAQELIDAVKDASPWVPETMQRLQDILTASGDYAPNGYKAHLAKRFIKTLLGRRIHLQEGRDRDAYKFYNYLIQGSAADMLKMCIAAMMDAGIIETDDAIGTLLLLIHDEAVFSVPMTPEGLAFILELQWFMENTVKLSVPVICDPEAGPNWADTEGQETDKDGKFTETAKQLIARMFKEAKSASKTKASKKTMALQPALVDNDDDYFVDFLLEGEDVDGEEADDEDED